MSPTHRHREDKITRIIPALFASPIKQLGRSGKREKLGKNKVGAFHQKSKLVEKLSGACLLIPKNTHLPEDQGRGARREALALTLTEGQE